MAIHVDGFDLSHPDTFNQIEKIINGFDDKEIKVAIIGGTNDERSKRNLLNIFTTLLKLSEKTNLDFIIEYQAIRHRNVFTDKNKPEFVYNKMIERLDILSRNYFKKPLDKKFIENKKVSDLINFHTKNDNDLLVFCVLIIHAHEVFKNSDKSQMMIYQSQASNIIKNENDFIKLAHRLFSVEGFNMIDNNYKINDLYNDARYNHFTFNFKTHDISIIKRSHFTPDEIIRDLHNIDFYNSKTTYFLCHDKNTNLTPTLTDKFIKYCSSLQKDVLAGFTKESGELFPQDALIKYKETSVNRNMIFRFVKLQMENKSQQSDLRFGPSLFDKQNPITLKDQGLIELDKKNYQLAGALFEKARDGFIEKPDSKSHQGDCHASLSDVNYGLNKLSTAINECENAMMCFYSCNDKNKLQEAEKKYFIYLAENKTDAKIFYSNACSDFKVTKNYYLASQKLLYTITKSNENTQPVQSATAHSTLASCYREMGSTPLAIEHCDKAIEILKKKNITKGLSDIEEKRDKMKTGMSLTM